MPDISMCKNHECPKRTTCWRYMASPSKPQCYGSFAHEGCKYYWPVADQAGGYLRAMDGMKQRQQMTDKLAEHDVTGSTLPVLHSKWKRVCDALGLVRYPDDGEHGYYMPTEDEVVEEIDRMSVELEAWRSGPLHRCPLDDGRCRYAIDREDRHEWEWFDTIEAAVDALMAEGEE